MTNEEKQLLLIDLCAKLPYGVKVETYWTFKDKKDKTFPVITLTNDMLGCYIGNKDYNIIMHYRPYLRPMSSMTEEERKEFNDFCVIDEEAWEGNSIIGFINQAQVISEAIGWLNSHYFDYRGLIEKGLALEAPEGMYNQFH